MSSEQLILEQKQLAQMIERVLINFKKDGPSRKTSEYISARLQQVAQYWDDFTILHKKIQECTATNHPYFTEDLYGKTRDIYNAVVDLIKNHQNKSTLLENQSETQSEEDINIPKTSAIPSTSFQPGLLPATSINQTMSEPIYSTITTTRGEKEHITTVQTTTSSPTIDMGVPPLTSIQHSWPQVSNPWNAIQQLPNPWTQQEMSKCNNFPKLPPVKIPKFNGDYREWKSFIDIFTNVIHDNTYISNVEKMQYLLYYLEGDAKRVISHLQLSSANYNTALQLIQARFNNNRKIISTYINAIIDAKKTEHRSQQDIIALFDLLRECLEALKNLNCNTDDWSPMIVCLVMRKLDAESLRLFEESLSNPREMPSISELLNFLEKRFQVLDCIKNSYTKHQKYDSFNNNKKRAFHTTLKRTCAMCNKDHHIYQCGEFKKLSIQDRNNLITQKMLCPNCLAHDRMEKCKTKYSCFYCKKRHHTLLHNNANDEKCKNTHATSKSIETNISAASTHMVIHGARDKEEASEDVTTFHVNKTKFSSTLLPTAMVRVKNIFGQTEMLRALIDPGSQVSLITEEAVQNLRLQKERIRATILGVAETESAKARGKVKISIQLRYKKNSYLTVEALVLPKLNSLLPETAVHGINMEKYQNIVLADPAFDTPGPIDLLLGADVYANILIDGLKKEQPAAQNTELGWIMFGSIPNTFQESTKVSSFVSLAEIDEKLEKFWEIEDTHSSSKVDEACEEHFKATHSRDIDGRYVVRLPFKENAGQLGQSKKRAMARLIQMERKLKKNSEDMAEYNKFLTEYLRLGHMSPAKPYIGEDSKVFYLPHHAVFKKDSTTTKLRVVFDASCKTESGTSLNDLLHCGPKIQQDLTQILLRWRKHRYVYTADIEKMFRQITVSEQDRNYQRILWRQQPTQPIQEYVLNTVTYGTGPATFLAVRTLQQLSEDEGFHFPIANKVLTSDFYIDDMLTGADTKAKARELQKQIIELLNKGGFNLRKWTSNNEELLKIIPEHIREDGILEIKECDTVKALGIHWHPKRDEFRFKFKFEDTENALTKRMLLSRIATIFDPLGWLAPVTLTAKLMMQSLWKAGTEWDQQPPTEITNAWKRLESELHHIESINIPRWIQYRAEQEIQLHGFCDASERGYAAVIYARTTDLFGKVHTTLVTAKTKVAPLKQKITLPRLELCGALLLAQLLKSTITTLEISEPKVFGWCDSEIALAWIAKNPNNWKTFVANRVAEIQKLFENHIWCHVSSEENPADVASRGISPSKLVTHELWWRGPLWLAQPPEAWPSKGFNTSTQEEMKKSVKVFNVLTSSSEIFNCSSYTRQVRAIAYCLRFIRNCKLPVVQRNTDHLSSEELQDSRNCKIKIVQQEVFSEEINMLKKGKQLTKTNKLLSLHPFLDKCGVLRVGGRLQNSNLSEDAKHQVLLPQKHHVTNIIIDHAHLQTLHGGTQLTLNYIRTLFWIINGKNVVQSRIHKCIKCTRYNQPSVQQLMGNLPTVRITPSPPFTHCGIDYAGPFLTRMSKGRGTKAIKGYIALFICMVTKAIHLELVSDLITDAFLAAYRRFIARRGNCKQIFSDNGTNFVGARNKMERDLQLAITNSTHQAAEIIANQGTEWKFIPSATPHFGGLWEAGVKSVKGHLKRVLGETLLTFEEFSTVLCQVEACLNSRPIGQQSSDPSDLEPLTPGHFLIGRPIIAPPEPDISNKEIHQRWKLVTKLHQDIWKRWSNEYLSLLQQRSKWKTGNKNPKIGELVLVKEDNLPPQKWSLGRIVQLHPGEDGIVRVVSVKYKTDVKKRPLNKLCQLPISIHNSDNDDPNCNATAMTSISLNTKARKRRINPDAELWSKPDHFDRITPQKGPNTISPAPQAKKRKLKIAPCTWYSRLLQTTIVLLYWLTVVFAKDYEMFYPKSGFYVENLGYTRIKRGNLRLQITFPIEEIFQDQKKIEAAWTQIKEMCEDTKKLTSTTHCEVLFQHMTTRKHTLLKATEEIIQLLQPKSRRRRGLLGSLLTSIFGVNDEIYTDIEALQHNQQSLLHMSNQQMIQINAKINNSNSIVEDKFKQFDSRLSQVIASVNEMKTWYSRADNNRISIEVISTYISAENYYDEIQEKYNHWVKAIHKNGHLLNFITIHDIDYAIKNASEKIGSNFCILRTPQHRLELSAENTVLKLYGYLHIIEKSTYDLMHITPIPHKIGKGSLGVANVRSSTFAINFNQQTYFNLEDHELKSCFAIENYTYLCTPTIVYDIQDSPSCVIDEIYNRHPKVTCEMRQVKLNGTVWKTLMMKNTWLYITTETKAAAVICSGQRKELLLNDTGIIHLQDDCYIETKEVKLKSTMDQVMEVISSHMKETIPATATLEFSKPPSFLKPGILIRPEEQIFDFCEEPEPITTLQKTLATHSITATTSILTSLILAVLLFKYWDNLKLYFTSKGICKRNEHKDQEASSQQFPQETPIKDHFDRILSSGAPQHVQS